MNRELTLGLVQQTGALTAAAERSAFLSESLLSWHRVTGRLAAASVDSLSSPIPRGRKRRVEHNLRRLSPAKVPPTQLGPE